MTCNVLMIRPHPIVYTLWIVKSCSMASAGFKPQIFWSTSPLLYHLCYQAPMSMSNGLMSLKDQPPSHSLCDVIWECSLTNWKRDQFLDISESILAYHSKTRLVFRSDLILDVQITVWFLNPLPFEDKTGICSIMISNIEISFRWVIDQRLRHYLKPLACWATVTLQDK